MTEIFSVTVRMPDDSEIRTTPQRMAAIAGNVFPASDRVPGAAGEAFDLAAWFAALTSEHASSAIDTNAIPEQPTHLIVRAADDFQAVIPWTELEGAFFLFAAEGQPLRKAGPVRLYVPDGSSACLNVKSVEHIRIASDSTLGVEAMYGFQHEISPARLSQGFRNRG